MTAKQPDELYNDEQATQRMEEALRRALNTRHKPLKAIVGKSGRSPNRNRRAKPKTDRKARG